MLHARILSRGSHTSLVSGASTLQPRILSSHSLTIVCLLHPGEGDPSQVALDEAQQEGSGLSLPQKGAFRLLAHKAHDVAVVTKAKPSWAQFSKRLQQIKV